MEPISLILTALVAGASAGALDALKDDVKEKAGAAYARLRGLVTRRVAGNPVAETALAQYEVNPKIWEAPLAEELTRSGAANDAELLAVAKALMELVDQSGAKSGKYTVTIKDAKGVQVGDGNVQVNRF
ncbi:MAG: hypothetical protein ACRDNW_06030 [Trebonia sp.]